MAPMAMNLNSKDSNYTWHLSLRVDRPVEGCTMRPHAYMYGKKLDERDFEKPLPLIPKSAGSHPLLMSLVIVGLGGLQWNLALLKVALEGHRSRLMNGPCMH
jgi:hypothetical protein